MRLPTGPQVELPMRDLPVAPVQGRPTISPVSTQPSISRPDVVPDGPLLLPSQTNYYSDNKK
ncbi:MAG TPA: hypothetical protein VFE62_30195 [Gemmataceae bacterium]|nr:hypothetical protein [Gemmataceae bacterium]